MFHLVSFFLHYTVSYDILLDNIHHLTQLYGDTMSDALVCEDRNMIPITDKDLSIKHTYSDGMYARTGTMKAGSMIVGHIHKYSCINVMSTGKMIVNHSGKTQVLEAPCTFKSEAGSRKVILILEDVVFTNIHKTDTIDLDELRKELLVEEDFIPEMLDIREEIIDLYNKKEFVCG